MTAPLLLDPKRLVGMTVRQVDTIGAEVIHQAERYLLVQCETADGEQFRLMFPIANCVKPSPNEKDVLENIRSGSRFFDLDDLAHCLNHEPLTSATPSSKPKVQIEKAPEVESTSDSALESPTTS